MKYSLDWLKGEIEKGNSIDYLFFWGHTQKVTSVIDKSCFSQWFPSPFIFEGTGYKTAEHWMMAKKAILFNDKEACEKNLNAESASVAKAIGREVKNFDAAEWNNISYTVVVEGNLYKFSQNEEIKQFLITTGNKVIVEASPVDAIWGIGLPQEAKNAADPFKWKGTNLLGFALMEVRDILNNE